MTADISPSRARFGAAIRRLGHEVVGHVVADPILDDLASTLLGAADNAAGGEARSRDVTGFHEHWNADLVDGEPVPSWGDRPFSGTCSPWGLEPDIRRHGDGIIATVTFGSAHEGAPQRCHGGIVAGLFDDVLGSVLGVIGEGAFTGELKIRYEAPVPLHRELTIVCRFDSRDGRKLYLSGEMLDGDQVICRASATFIQPREAPTQTTFDPA